MRDGNAGVGELPFDARGALGDRLHAVVQVIHLSAALHLTPHGVGQDRLGIFQHEGLHRIAVVRRFFYGGHVPQAGERHVQRPGNGRGGERQNVHAAGKLLEFFLVAHAEALLLVHDQQAEVLESHILLQQLVRADHQIQRAGAQIRKGLALLRGCGKSGEHPDIHREAAEAVHRGGVVLLGEHRRRH